MRAKAMCVVTVTPWVSLQKDQDFHTTTVYTNSFAGVGSVQHILGRTILTPKSSCSELFRPQHVALDFLP